MSDPMLFTDSMGVPRWRLIRWFGRPGVLSVLSLLFSSAVAFLVWELVVSWNSGFGLAFCTPQNVETHGAAIRSALVLVLVAGLAESILIGLAHRPDLRFGSVLLGSATLGFAIALVGFDGGRYTAVDTSGDCGNSTNHLGFLYGFWGVPLALLLLQALRIWRGAASSRPANAGDHE